MVSSSGPRSVKALSRQLVGENCEASTPTRTATTAELFLFNQQRNMFSQSTRFTIAYDSG